MANIIVRMGAPYWDARIRRPDGSVIHFDFRHMEKKERSAFHRELMNAFRQVRNETQLAA